MSSVRGCVKADKIPMNYDIFTKSIQTHATFDISRLIQKCLRMKMARIREKKQKQREYSNIRIY